MNRYAFTVLFWIFMLTPSLRAVQPHVWLHQDQKHFSEAERNNAVVDSHGDVTPGPQIETLIPSEDAPDIISSISVGGGGKTIFAGSGTDGVIYRITGDEVKKYAEIPATVVTTLVPLGGGAVLAGGGGENAGLYGISKGKARRVFFHKDVQYIWQVLITRKCMYLATGPNGKVFRLDSEFKGGEIYSAGKLAKNILCLAPGPKGHIYAGTDEKGLVLEINTKRKTGRVIYDASEKEISSLVADGNGGVFAATSDMSKIQGDASPDGKKDGRPATPATAAEAKKEDDAKDASPAENKKETTEKSPASSAAKNKEQTNEDKDSGADQGDEPKTDTPSEEKRDNRKQTTPTKEDATDAAASAKTAAAGAARNTPAKNEKEGPGKKTVSADEPKVIIIKKSGSPPSATSPKKKPSTVSKPSQKGNAVYHITSDGAAKAIFRMPILIQAMLARKQRLILASGNEGRIYFVTTDGQLSGELVDTEAKQVTSLAVDAQNAILFTTANGGSAGRILTDPAKKGTLVSKPLDAKNISRWGTLRVDGTTPRNTALSIATRSGNLSEPDDNSWSDWSGEIPLQDGFAHMGSPAARFLQYRVTMTSGGNAVPVLQRIKLIYQQLNMQPEITAIEVQETGQDPKRKTSAPNKVFRIITLKAADANGDTLRYKLEYRRADSDAWVTIEDSFDKTKYVWDTRSFEDGVYTLRVTATDAPANPEASAMSGARLSEPIVLDTTAPTLAGIQCKVRGKTATISGKITDELSRIARIQYRVDSAEQWNAVLPVDNICDSNRESFTFKVPDLDPGIHRISIRATDVLDNTGYGGCDARIK